MKKKLLFNSLITLAILCNNTLPAQARRVPTNRPNTALVKAIREGIPSEIYNSTSYYFTEVDLNSDGAKDAIVYMFGSLDICGTRNCPVYVFQRRGSSYQRILEGIAPQPEVAVLKSKSKGWFDIAIASGDLVSGYYWRVWKYDGTSYEESEQKLSSTPSRIILNPKSNSAISLTEPGRR